MNNKFVAVVVVAIVVIAGAAVCVTTMHNDDKNNIDLVSSKNYLKIFGNANGDHLLNNDDVKIIEDYISGSITEKDLITVKENDNGKTYYLADANLDGKVDSSDISYLKGLIDRSGEKMNLIDTFDHLVSVPLTNQRIACDYFATAELLNLVGVQDKIVCATNALMVLKDCYLMNAPVDKIVNYYSRTAPDFEAVAEANPNIWVVSEDYGPRYEGNTTAAVVGLDTLVFDFDDVMSSSPIMSALLAGYIFNNVDAGISYVNWYLDTWNKLYSVSSKLSDSNRPSVFYTGYGGYITDQSDKKLRVFLDNTVCWQAVKLAGGYNTIDDYPGTLTPTARPTNNLSLDIEWIAEQDYDYLFVHCTKYTGSGTVSKIVPDHGVTCDDPSEYKTAQKDLANIDILGNSCKAENMYLTPGDYMNGASGGLLSAILVACVIHPDIFSDLSLEEEHQKYVDLIGFDYDVSKHGTFFVSN